MFTLKLVRKFYRGFIWTFALGGAYNLGKVEGKHYPTNIKLSWLDHINQYIHNFLSFFYHIPTLLSELLNIPLTTMYFLFYGLTTFIFLFLIYILVLVITFVGSFIDRTINRTFLGKYDQNICLNCSENIGNLKEVQEKLIINELNFKTKEEQYITELDKLKEIQKKLNINELNLKKNGSETSRY